jgi:hypothetical protein
LVQDRPTVNVLVDVVDGAIDFLTETERDKERQREVTVDQPKVLIQDAAEIDNTRKKKQERYKDTQIRYMPL